MSLQTDMIFVKALRSDGALMAALAAGDVYNTSVERPDADVYNTPLPYVIVSFDGLTASPDMSTKDDEYDTFADRVQVGIEIAARTRPQLGLLAEAVRRTVKTYFADHRDDDTDPAFELIPYGMTMTASEVSYDPQKPCYWQTLNYECDVDV